MRRGIARNVLIAACVAPLTDASVTFGQIFTRAVHEVAVEGENRSCGILGCPPQATTHGYYHEHWRRWPEEYVSPAQIHPLSPFATPNRNVPATNVPDPRDEGLTSPRVRANSDSGRAAAAPSGAAAAPAPTSPPADEAIRPVPPAAMERSPLGDGSAATLPEEESTDLPSDLPSGNLPADAPAGPSGGSEADSFFPDESEDLEALPFDDDAPFPPSSRSNPRPHDDGFELDFGYNDQQRMRRYQSGGMSQMRPATRSARYSQRRTSATASHRRAAADRELIAETTRPRPSRSRASMPSRTVQQEREQEIALASANEELRERDEQPIRDAAQQAPVEPAVALEPTAPAASIATPASPEGSTPSPTASSPPTARKNPLRRG